MLSQETVKSSVELITALTRDTIPGTVGCGVTLVDVRGRTTTASASDPVVAAADSLQYDLGEGPCLTALAKQQVVRVDDVRTDRRWPWWSEAVHPLGMASVLSAPLVVAGSAAIDEHGG